VEQGGSVLLIGEDEIFGMYADVVRQSGLRATVHRSPGDAILEVPDVRPDVIVTELAFGGQTRIGCHFISAMRQDPATADSIILVVSGHARRADQQRARQCGADRFFAKPLLPEALLQEVVNAVRCRREHRRPDWNRPPPTGDRRRSRRRS
jgi:CheY-like chemotaxis protein